MIVKLEVTLHKYLLIDVLIYVKPNKYQFNIWNPLKLITFKSIAFKLHNKE